MIDRDFAFSHLTWVEAEEAARGNAALILPVGSTEPHGPHLSLDTDVLIAEAMATRAAARLRESGQKAYVLPPIAYAVTDFAKGFGGAVSVSARTASALIEEVCRSLISLDFQTIAIATAHLEPAHLASVRDACARMKETAGVEPIFPDITTKRWGRMLNDEFRSGACHAGSFETSVVMVHSPEDVREEMLAQLPPVPISLSRGIKEGITTFMEAGGERAYFGDPAASSAEEGERTIDTLAEILVTAIGESRSA
jgi:creatinine amidohydrolase